MKLPENIEALIAKSEHLSELIDYPREVSEAAHEYADNNERVIYHHKAHDNVREATSEELSEAESSFEDCGGLGEKYDGGAYDRIAVLLSYWLEYHRYNEEVRNAISEIEDVIDEVENETTDLTFSTNDGSEFGWQSGDNSFTGGAYGLPHWAVVTIDPDSNQDEVLNEIIDQWQDLLEDYDLTEKISDEMKEEILGIIAEKIETLERYDIEDLKEALETIQG